MCISEFAAIDFETATASRNSACSIAIAVVRNEKVVDVYKSLIQPPNLEFDDRLTNIHGISASDVKDAPLFTDIWQEVERRCSGLVVAHNASFDLGVMAACATDEQYNCLAGKYACTVDMSRKVFPGLPNHRLPTLAKVLGIGLDHHDATSDSVTCASLACLLFRVLGNESMSYFREFAEFGHQSDRNEMRSICVSISIDDLVDDESISSSGVTNLPAPDGRFDQMRFAFTGQLAFLGRSEAAKIVEQYGGTAAGSVSKKTDVVVVGDEVLATYKKSGHATGKLAKAIAISEKGTDIRIVSESEFMEMLR